MRPTLPAGFVRQFVRQDWMDDARCRGMDPDLFHTVSPQPGSRAATYHPAAVEACEACPVRRQCADYAIHNEPVGYWGGMTPKQRQMARRAA